MYVYAQLGIALPHFAAAQFGFGVPVPRDQLQPGDLVFFDNLNHVGISLGGNEFVDAPHTGDVVKISTITGWYEQNYVGARRLIYCRPRQGAAEVDLLGLDRPGRPSRRRLIGPVEVGVGNDLARRGRAPRASCPPSYGRR